MEVEVQKAVSVVFSRLKCSCVFDPCGPIIPAGSFLLDPAGMLFQLDHGPSHGSLEVFWEFFHTSRARRKGALSGGPHACC